MILTPNRVHFGGSCAAALLDNLAASVTGEGGLFRIATLL
jgi:hypothetical protein